MPRNTLNDLNNHLFMQLERLNYEDLKEEDLQKEIARAKAITNLAAQIINNGSLVLRAQEFKHEYGLFDGEGSQNGKTKKLPPLLRAEFLRE